MEKYLGHEPVLNTRQNHKRTRLSSGQMNNNNNNNSVGMTTGSMDDILASYKAAAHHQASKHAGNNDRHCFNVFLTMFYNGSC